jgi:hypothetical protein
VNQSFGSFFPLLPDPALAVLDVVPPPGAAAGQMRHPKSSWPDIGSKEETIKKEMIIKSPAG